MSYDFSIGDININYTSNSAALPDSHFLYSSASEATIARQAIIDAAGTYDHDY